ncbi:hypothetical protein TNCV_3194801 [Trichonephila clavipes]|uniref:Uncharacterized protein n=1 Tax=Trichonephila clavipes TaxID=2585209 RepID=A0A8X6V0E6_TRICX|nr:hypothetical protein TNCV_3194801 [Trichonephila clavipes]
MDLRSSRRVLKPRQFQETKENINVHSLLFRSYMLMRLEGSPLKLRHRLMDVSLSDPVLRLGGTFWTDWIISSGLLGSSVPEDGLFGSWVFWGNC